MVSLVAKPKEGIFLGKSVRVRACAGLRGSVPAHDSTQKVFQRLLAMKGAYSFLDET
jgi:hypothetical protein